MGWLQDKGVDAHFPEFTLLTSTALPYDAGQDEWQHTLVQKLTQSEQNVSGEMSRPTCCLNAAHVSGFGILQRAAPVSAGRRDRHGLRVLLEP